MSFIQGIKAGAAGVVTVAVVLTVVVVAVMLKDRKNPLGTTPDNWATLTSYTDGDAQPPKAAPAPVKPVAFYFRYIPEPTPKPAL